MHSQGNTNFSSNNADWGSLGSYIGGIFTPIAALISGYFVYLNFSANAFQQKLLLIRESLARLDSQLENKFDMPFNSNRLGEEYIGVPFKKIVYAISNKEIVVDKVTNDALLALLHDIAILTTAIRYYMHLLERVPSQDDDSNWLSNLEQGYWIQKYSAISNRILKIVGNDAFNEKATEQQVESFNFVLKGKKTNYFRENQN